MGMPLQVAPAEGVLLRLCVGEGVPDPVPLGVPVALPVGVTERDADREVLPELLPLAPTDREAAALTDTVLLLVALAALSSVVPSPTAP